jgi:sugar/nucleoside kinase (ribokinase family)
MTISAAPDYVIVGHVIKDKVADGYRLGGTVSFAGAVVQALGGSLGIVSAADADGRALAVQQFPGAEFSWVKSEETTVYENIYSASGRVQYCLALADKVSVADFPEEWRSASIVHLGPLTSEVPPNIVDCLSNDSLVGVTPQGWLRRRRDDGLIEPTEWDSYQTVLERCDVLIFSEHDPRSAEECRRYLGAAKLAVVTRGEQGADVHTAGSVTHIPTYPACEIDPTGAGDGFCGAFLMEYHRTGSAIDACRFASAAAAFLVEDTGVNGAARECQIRERMEGPTQEH